MSEVPLYAACKRCLPPFAGRAAERAAHLGITSNMSATSPISRSSIFCCRANMSQTRQSGLGFQVNVRRILQVTPSRRAAERAAQLGITSDMVYRGTSLIRDSHPHRITVGP